MTKKAKVTVNAKDNAFIVRHKGYDDQGQELVEPEMLLRNMDDEENVPPHLVAITACFIRIIIEQDQDFMNQMAEWFVDEKRPRRNVDVKTQ